MFLECGTAITTKPCSVVIYRLADKDTKKEVKPEKSETEAPTTTSSRPKKKYQINFKLADDFIKLCDKSKEKNEPLVKSSKPSPSLRASATNASHDVSNRNTYMKPNISSGSSMPTALNNYEHPKDHVTKPTKTPFKSSEQKYQIWKKAFLEGRNERPAPFTHPDDSGGGVAKKSTSFLFRNINSNIKDENEPKPFTNNRRWLIQNAGFKTTFKSAQSVEDVNHAITPGYKLVNQMESGLKNGYNKQRKRGESKRSGNDDSKGATAKQQKNYGFKSKRVSTLSTLKRKWSYVQDSCNSNSNSKSSHHSSGNSKSKNNNDYSDKGKEPQYVIDNSKVDQESGKTRIVLKTRRSQITSADKNDNAEPSENVYKGRKLPSLSIYSKIEGNTIAEVSCKRFRKRGKHQSKSSDSAKDDNYQQDVLNSVLPRHNSVAQTVRETVDYLMKEVIRENVYENVDPFNGPPSHELKNLVYEFCRENGYCFADFRNLNKLLEYKVCSYPVYNTEHSISQEQTIGMKRKRRRRVIASSCDSDDDDDDIALITALIRSRTRTRTSPSAAASVPVQSDSKEIPTPDRSPSPSVAPPEKPPLDTYNPELSDSDTLPANNSDIENSQDIENPTTTYTSPNVVDNNYCYGFTVTDNCVHYNDNLIVDVAADENVGSNVELEDDDDKVILDEKSGLTIPVKKRRESSDAMNLVGAMDNSQHEISNKEVPIAYAPYEEDDGLDSDSDNLVICLDTSASEIKSSQDCETSEPNSSRIIEGISDNVTNLLNNDQCTEELDVSSSDKNSTTIEIAYNYQFTNSDEVTSTEYCLENFSGLSTENCAELPKNTAHIDSPSSKHIDNSDDMPRLTREDCRDDLHLDNCVHLNNEKYVVLDKEDCTEISIDHFSNLPCENYTNFEEFSYSSLDKIKPLCKENILEIASRFSGINTSESVPELCREDYSENVEALSVENIVETVEVLSEENVVENIEVYSVENAVENIEVYSVENTVENVETLSVENSVENVETLSVENSVENVETLSVENSVENVETLFVENSVENVETLSVENSVENVEALSVENSVKNVEALSAENSVENVEALSAENSVENVKALSVENAVENITECSRENNRQNLLDCVSENSRPSVLEYSMENSRESLVEYSGENRQSVLELCTESSRQSVLELCTESSRQSVLELCTESSRQSVLELCTENTRQSVLELCTDNSRQSELESCTENSRQSVQEVSIENNRQSVLEFSKENSRQSVLEFSKENSRPSVLEFSKENSRPSVLEFSKENSRQSVLEFSKENSRQSVLEFSKENSRQSVLEFPKENNRKNVLEFAIKNTIENGSELSSRKTNEFVTNLTSKISNEYATDFHKDINSENIRNATEEIVILNVPNSPENNIENSASDHSPSPSVPVHNNYSLGPTKTFTDFSKDTFPADDLANSPKSDLRVSRNEILAGSVTEIVPNSSKVIVDNFSNVIVAKSPKEIVAHLPKKVTTEPPKETTVITLNEIAATPPNDVSANSSAGSLANVSNPLVDIISSPRDSITNSSKEVVTKDSSPEGGSTNLTEDGSTTSTEGDSTTSTEGDSTTSNEGDSTTSTEGDSTTSTEGDSTTSTEDDYTNSPAAIVTNSPKARFASSPKNGFSNTPKDGFTTLPKKHFANSPKNNFADSPKNNFTNSPKNNFAASPKNNFTISPEDNFINLPKNSFANSTKNNFANSTKNSFANSTKNNFASFAKDNFSDSPMESFADSPKEKFTDSSKDNFADSSKDNFANSPKETVANSPKDNFANSPKVNFANSPKETVANSPKDNFANSPKVNFANSPKETVANSPKDNFANSPKDNFANSPKDNFASSPKDNFANLLKEDVANSLKEGVAHSLKEDVANSPKEGVANSPRDSFANWPKEDVANSPKEGVANSPRDSFANWPKEDVANSPKESSQNSPKDNFANSPKVNSAKSPKDNFPKSPKDNFANSPKNSFADNFANSPKESFSNWKKESCANWKKESSENSKTDIPPKKKYKNSPSSSVRNSSKGNFTNPQKNNFEDKQKDSLESSKLTNQSVINSPKEHSKESSKEIIVLDENSAGPLDNVSNLPKNSSTSDSLTDNVIRTPKDSRKEFLLNNNLSLNKDEVKKSPPEILTDLSKDERANLPNKISDKLKDYSIEIVTDLSYKMPDVSAASNSDKRHVPNGNVVNVVCSMKTPASSVLSECLGSTLEDKSEGSNPVPIKVYSMPLLKDLVPVSTEDVRNVIVKHPEKLQPDQKSHEPNIPIKNTLTDENDDQNPKRTDSHVETDLGLNPKTSAPVHNSEEEGKITLDKQKSVLDDSILRTLLQESPPEDFNLFLENAVSSMNIPTTGNTTFTNVLSEITGENSCPTPVIVNVMSLNKDANLSTDVLMEDLSEPVKDDSKEVSKICSPKPPNEVSLQNKPPVSDRSESPEIVEVKKVAAPSPDTANKNRNVTFEDMVKTLEKDIGNLEKMAKEKQKELLLITKYKTYKESLLKSLLSTRGEPRAIPIPVLPVSASTPNMTRSISFGQVNKAALNNEISAPPVNSKANEDPINLNSQKEACLVRPIVREATKPNDTRRNVSPRLPAPVVQHSQTKAPVKNVLCATNPQPYKPPVAHQPQVPSTTHAGYPAHQKTHHHHPSPVNVSFSNVASLKKAIAKPDSNDRYNLPSLPSTPSPNNVMQDIRKRNIPPNVTMNHIPISNSLVGPNGQTIQKPLSGPTSQTVQKLLAGPSSQTVQKPLGGNNIQSVPKNVVGPNMQSVPKNIVGPNMQSVPKNIVGPNMQPVPKNVVGPNIQPVPKNIVGPNIQPIPKNIVGPNIQGVPKNIAAPNIQGVPKNIVGLNSQGVPKNIEGPNSHDNRDISKRGFQPYATSTSPSLRVPSKSKSSVGEKNNITLPMMLRDTPSSDFPSYGSIGGMPFNDKKAAPQYPNMNPMVWSPNENNFQKHKPDNIPQFPHSNRVNINPEILKNSFLSRESSLSELAFNLAISLKEAQACAPNNHVSANTTSVANTSSIATSNIQSTTHQDMAKMQLQNIPTNSYDYFRMAQTHPNMALWSFVPYAAMPGANMAPFRYPTMDPRILQSAYKATPSNWDPKEKLPIPSNHHQREIQQQNLQQKANLHNPAPAARTSQPKPPPDPKTTRFRKCMVCNTADAQFICSGCGKDWYCSVECQRENWKVHSRVCSS